MQKFLDKTGLIEVWNKVKSYVNSKPHSNPNLLDNWYFADPINQRGQMEYTAGGYAIDRWKLTNTSAEVEGLYLTEDGIKIKCSGATTSNIIPFTQLFEKPLEKRTYTFSCLVNEISGKWKVGHKYANSTDLKIGLNIFTFSVNKDDINSLYFWQIPKETENDYISIKAVKLELGDQQTLAHQEGDAWVLNDPPPNKALELAKCQRYYVSYENLPAIGLSNVDGSTLLVVVYAPVSMRIKPAIAEVVINWIRGDGGTISSPGTTMEVSDISENAITVRVKPSAALNIMSPYAISFTKLVLSADL